MKTKVTKVLRRCRITSRYSGYRYLPDVVSVASQNGEESLCNMRSIYSVVSQTYHVPPRDVERNIHTVVERCWLNNRDYIAEIMGYHACKCPGNAQFIDALIYYILNKYPELDQHIMQ